MPLAIVSEFAKHLHLLPDALGEEFGEIFKNQSKARRDSHAINWYPKYKYTYAKYLYVPTGDAFSPGEHAKKRVKCCIAQPHRRKENRLLERQ